MIKKTFLLALIFSVLAVTFLPGRAEAAEFVTGPGVLIGPDEVVDEDVYAFAGQITVEGTINGDLVAAGGSIDISGTVNGDVIVGGGSITISGVVQDDIRAGGNSILISAPVGGDVIVGGETVIIEPEATIGDDLVAGAGALVMRGVVNGDLDVDVRDLRIAGTVRGDVDANVGGRFRVGPDRTSEGGLTESRVEGKLTYTSGDDVILQPGAQVIGDITKNVPMSSVLGMDVQDSTLINVANEIISQIRWFLGTVFVGLLLLWLFPETTRGVISTLFLSPWRSLGMGAGVLVVTPILVFVLGGIAIFVGGFAAIPIAAIPGAIYLGLLLLATPLIAVLIGGFVFTRITKREDYAPWIALIIGAAILSLIGFVPFLDVIVGILTILFGFGVWLLYFYRLYREARVTQRI